MQNLHEELRNSSARRALRVKKSAKGVASPSQGPIDGSIPPYRQTKHDPSENRCQKGGGKSSGMDDGVGAFGAVGKGHEETEEGGGEGDADRGGGDQLGDHKWTESRAVEHRYNHLD